MPLKSLTDLLDKASHLAIFCAWDSSPHLPVTPQQCNRCGLVLAETHLFTEVCIIDCLCIISVVNIIIISICTFYNFPGPGDVWLSLRGTTYQNNSCVALEDIGNSNTDSLLCRTNSTNCCRSSDSNSGNALGHWFFPNGTKVPTGTTKSDLDLHRTRGKMVVRMHRRRGGEEGIYRCEIPDSTDVTQIIYIRLYTASVGECYR